MKSVWNGNACLSYCCLVLECPLFPLSLFKEQLIKLTSSVKSSLTVRDHILLCAPAEPQFSACLYLHYQGHELLKGKENLSQFLIPRAQSRDCKVLMYFEFICTFILMYNKCKNLPEGSSQRVTLEKTSPILSH